MKIGLFFGTFNPIHVGHLIIANAMVMDTDLDKVWMIVSPQNPHKVKKSILSDYHRLALVRIAVEDNNDLIASNVEFSLSKPSYTIHTVTHLREKYPEHEFVLIMGEDNLRSFTKWKNYEEILKSCELYVYPRNKRSDQNEIVADALVSERVTVFDVPVMQISSSLIRSRIKEKKGAQYLVTPAVLKYIEEMHFYSK